MHSNYLWFIFMQDSLCLLTPAVPAGNATLSCAKQTHVALEHIEPLGALRERQDARGAAESAITHIFETSSNNLN